MAGPTSGQPPVRLDQRALEREIRADARAERRVLAVGLVAAVVTIAALALLSTLR
ncbi:hypothetical protein [Cellulomonas uda]|nr:hypothetical protein [Cellulomonas uda]NII67874.1 hypothetical protein [Cellulomonas uda]